MNMKLLGFKHVDFTNKQGERIVGDNLFVCYKTDDIEGLCTDRFFVNENISLPSDLHINDTICVSFSPKGKLLGITKVK